MSKHLSTLILCNVCQLYSDYLFLYRSPSYKKTVSLLNDNPYVFVQVDGTEQQGYGGSYNNVAEGQAVVELVTQLRRDDREWHSPEKIRIITFYQAQVSLLKRMLSERGLTQVVVATVDSSQGCEADICIISFVRSITRNSQRGSHSSAGFLSDDRRLNVAMTRAKYQLICVGNAEGLKLLPEDSTLHALSQDVAERDCVCPAMLLGLHNKNREGGKKDGGTKKKHRSRGGRGDNNSRKRQKRSRPSGAQNQKPNKGKGAKP